MSAEIMNALTRLGDVVEKVENSTSRQEQKVLQLKQQDLFASPAGSASANSPANSNGNNNGHDASLDKSVIAQKLDSAISKVEQILQEA